MVGEAAGKERTAEEGSLKCNTRHVLCLRRCSLVAQPAETPNEDNCSE